jgi:hypothetical protein
VEWIFSHGLRPNRMQSQIWNEHSRKLGWNDRVTTFLHNQKQAAGLADHAVATVFGLIDLSEGRLADPA